MSNDNAGARRRSVDGTTSGDETRRRILEALCARPGLTQTELTQRVGRGWGTLQYHLRKLLKINKVQTYAAGRERRYFPGGRDPRVMKQIAVLRRGRVLDVAGNILRQPGMPQWQLAKEVAMTRKILRAYLDLLVDAGLIKEIELPAVHRYYPTTDLSQVLLDFVPALGSDVQPEERPPMAPR